jgi:hypothetical protein
VRGASLSSLLLALFFGLCAFATPVYAQTPTPDFIPPPNAQNVRPSGLIPYDQAIANIKAQDAARSKAMHVIRPGEAPPGEGTSNRR